MFGYFRFHDYSATWKMKQYYKNYYCGTCFALEHNYGQKARFLLSYDVTILAILISAHQNPMCEQLPCYLCKNKKQQFKLEDWKKVAAVNILLFSSKLDDDINDENSAVAKFLKIVYKNVINKAKNDYPNLASVIDGGYEEIAKKEANGCDVPDLCACFSKMMTDVVSHFFDVDENKVKFISAISGWLYFIDQLDDYDKDVKKNKYNALVIDGVSKKDYLNLYNTQIRKYLSWLMADFQSVKDNMDVTIPECRILYSIINDTIPSVTWRVLTDKQLPRLLHRKKRMEWSD